MPDRTKWARELEAQPSAERLRGARMAGLIEIEIAQRFFDRTVFSFFQAFGEFARQQIFLGFFRFDRSAEFRLDGIDLLAKQAGGVFKIHRGWRAGRRDVREDGANLAIDGQFCLAARAIYFEGIHEFVGHEVILPQFWLGRGGGGVWPSTALFRVGLAMFVRIKDELLPT